jgi:hypothetical protein
MHYNLQQSRASAKRTRAIAILSPFAQLQPKTDTHKTDQAINTQQLNFQQNIHAPTT